jgi:hypothetical protein
VYSTTTFGAKLPRLLGAERKADNVAGIDTDGPWRAGVPDICSFPPFRPGSRRWTMLL